MYLKFLSKNKQIKLKILQDIAIKAPSNLDYLSESLHLSNKTLKRYISEINSELKFTSPETIISTDENGLWIIHSYNQKTYTNLKEYYLNSSTSFQLCKSLCYTEKLTITTICEQLLISRAHAYRTIHSLNKLVTPFHLSISINQKGSYYLHGEELAIRLFIFNFINQCIPTKEWPFPTTSKVEMQTITLTITSLPKSEYLQRQLLIFLAIFQNRIKNKHYLPISKNQREQTFLNLFEYFPAESTITFLKSLYLSNVEIITIERLYLSFFAHILLADTLTQNDLVTIGNKISILNDPVIALFQKLMLEEAKEFSYTITKKGKKLFMYYYTLAYVLSFFINRTLLNIWYLELPEFGNDSVFDKELQYKLLDFFLEFIKNNVDPSEWIDWLNPISATNFGSISYIQFQQQQKPPVPIYCYFTKSFNTKNFISQLLTKTYNQEFFYFNESTKKAKIIITDCFDFPTTKDQDLVVLTNCFDREQIHTLLNTINKYIF